MLLFLGIPLNQLQVFLTLVISTFGQLPTQLIEMFFHTGGIGKGLEHLTPHGRVIFHQHNLWEIAYSRLVGYGNNTGSGFLFTTKYTQHGCLTCSVLANQCYAVSVVDDKTGILKQWFYTKLNF